MTNAPGSIWDDLGKAHARIRELEAHIAAEPDRMRLQGQAEGFAAAVSWLRERAVMKPPATLWGAAEILADQLEQSRIPASAQETGQ